MEKKIINSKLKNTLLIILCWLVYTSSYVGRLGYSANINHFIDEYGVSYSQAGLVSTCFFFAYGIGQVINGFLCKKYNIKLIISVSLFISIAMNILLLFNIDFEFIKFIWLINGIAMSFLWTSLIRLLSENIHKDEISKSVNVMGTTVAIGTFIVYGLSSIFTAINNFKLIFIVASSLMFFVLIIWLISFNKLTSKEKVENNSEEIKEEIKPKISKSVIILVSLLAFFAVANNLVKDGLTIWTPTILSNLYNTPDWLSILLTLLLPFMAIFGTFLATFLHRYIKDFITLCMTLCLGASVLSIIVLILFSYDALIIIIICFALVSCLMAGVNNIITSMVPLELKKKVGSGFLAGILNGFCYLGSTLSTYGLGLIAEHFSWEGVFITLIIVNVVAVFIGLINLLIKKLKNE